MYTFVESLFPDRLHVPQNPMTAKLSRSAGTVLLAMLIFSAASCFTSAPAIDNLLDTPQTLPHIHIAHGAYDPGDSQALGERVFRDADTWNGLRIAGAEYEPDFDTENVIFASINANTGGYSVSIDSVYVQDRQIHVDYTVSQPGGNCFVTQALTRPYHAVAVPTLPEEAEVTFTQHRRTYQCED